MTTQITLNCCEGNEKYSGQCLREKCPVYCQSKQTVRSNWPWVGTGYGNLYGNPNHSNYLEQVKQDVKIDTKKVE